MTPIVRRHMNTCKRCSECEGDKHHWITEPEDEDIVTADEVFITCKHCELKVLMNDEEAAQNS